MCLLDSPTALTGPQAALCFLPKQANRLNALIIVFKKKPDYKNLLGSS
jgi:hypothetical protein